MVMERGMCPTGTWSAYNRAPVIVARQPRERTTHHLLDFDLLKRSEATRAGLHVQRSTDAILLAAVLVLAIEYWLEVFPRDILERF